MDDGTGRSADLGNDDETDSDRRPTQGSDSGAEAPRVVRPRRQAAAAEDRHAEDRSRRDDHPRRERGDRQGDPQRRDRGPEVRRPEGTGPQGARPEGRRPEGNVSDRRRPEDAPARRRRPTEGTQGRAANTATGTRRNAGRRTPAVEEEYVPLPRSTSTQRRVLTVIGVVVLLIGAILGGVLLWASRQINPSGPPGKVVEVINIPKGSSTPAIARVLAENDIISSDRIFTIYVGLKRKGGWKAGDYVDFRQNSGFDDVIQILDAGPIPPASKVVRIPEGTRLVDALEMISSEMGTVSVEQLQAALDSGEVRSAYKPDDVASWEGLLFPDTYQLAETDTAAVILQKMVTRMDDVLDSLGYDRAQALAGVSAYQLVTIASLIERETGQPAEERGKISRVIFNRLDAGETLGLDASILYGLGRASGGLTKADLEQDTPYNTRIHTGLPPTPIGLPGEASLQAAIEPTPGDWKYYVLTSNDPPSHFFTSSYQEFVREKNDAQRRGVF